MEITIESMGATVYYLSKNQIVCGTIQEIVTTACGNKNNPKISVKCLIATAEVTQRLPQELLYPSVKSLLESLEKEFERK